MIYDEIACIRDLMCRSERGRRDAAKIFQYEEEYFSAKSGISLIVSVHDGSRDIANLLTSLRCQNLDREKYQIIFALSGRDRGSMQLINEFRKSSAVDTIVLSAGFSDKASARNEALQHVAFRSSTFVEYHDHISRCYLDECVKLSNYRSVIVSNVISVSDGMPAEDSLQDILKKSFEFSHVNAPEDIGLCYLPYTFNSLKTAPSYMLKRIGYDGGLGEDVKYWRDVFHKFTPITIKSPSRRDLYFRTAIEHPYRSKMTEGPKPTDATSVILNKIAADAEFLDCDSPQRKFDSHLEKFLITGHSVF